jgi:hypothetical protein
MQVMIFTGANYRSASTPEIRCESHSGRRLGWKDSDFLMS